MSWPTGLILVLLGLSMAVAPIITPGPDQSHSRVALPEPKSLAAIVFLLSASPTSLSIVQGYSGWSTVYVTTLPGQVGEVNLTASTPVGLTATLNPPTVSLPPSPGSAFLTIIVGAMTAPGTYYVTVNGVSGGSSDVLAISVTVLPAAAPSLTITPSPASLALPAGTDGTSTITVNSVNGFSGDVRLTATTQPNAPSASFSPTDVRLVADGTAHSTMRIAATSYTISGNYTIRAQVSNGTISDSWPIVVFVGGSPVDFNLTAIPASMSVPAGANGTSTITVKSVNGFTGDVRLTAATSPSGPSPALSLGDVPLTSAISSGTSTLRVVTTSSTAPGTYVVKVNGTANRLFHYVAFLLVVRQATPPTFSLSAAPGSVAIQTGGSGDSTIKLKSLNGFSGDVKLSVVVVLPSTGAPTILFSPPDVMLSSGQTATSTLTVSAASSTASGNYTVLFQGSNGVVSNSWIIEVFVNTMPLDFSIIATPSALSATPGSSATSTITLTSLNGFSGNIGLTPFYVSPLVAARPMTVVSPSTSTLVAGGTTTSSVTIYANSTTPLGSYQLALRGASGPAFSHVVDISVNVTSSTQPSPDFRIFAVPASITIQAGSSGSSTVTLTRLNGFIGSVTLRATGSPSGLATALNPLSITLSDTAPSATSVLSVSAQAATPGGYAVTIVGTSGLQSRPVGVHITVTSAPVQPPPSTPPQGSSPRTILGLPLLQFYGITGALAVAIVLVSILAYRRSRPQSR